MLGRGCIGVFRGRLLSIHLCVRRYPTLTEDFGREGFGSESGGAYMFTGVTASHQVSIERSGLI